MQIQPWMKQEEKKTLDDRKPQKQQKKNVL